MEGNGRAGDRKSTGLYPGRDNTSGIYRRNAGCRAPPCYVYFREPAPFTFLPSHFAKIERGDNHQNCAAWRSLRPERKLALSIARRRKNARFEHLSTGPPSLRNSFVANEITAITIEINLRTVRKYHVINGPTATRQFLLNIFALAIYATCF